MPIRLFIVDPLEIARAGVRQLCMAQDQFLFVGEADNLLGSESAIADAAPDVVIVDFDCMTSMAMQQVSSLVQRHPTVRVLIYSTVDDAELATRFLNAGALGFLVKAARLEEMAVAIRSLYSGRVFVSHSPHPRQLIGSPVFSESLSGDGSTSDLLSQREREVISLVADGLTNRQIAEKLVLSVKTIETYRARVMRKHGLTDRAQVIRFAKRWGLTDLAS